MVKADDYVDVSVQGDNRMIPVEETIYSLAMQLLASNDAEEVRRQLHVAVDNICDGIEYGATDEV